jgi:hypothetical protein
MLILDGKFAGSPRQTEEKMKKSVRIVITPVEIRTPAKRSVVPEVTVGYTEM